MSTKVTPDGSGPDSDRLAVGAPVDWTVKDPLTVEIALASPNLQFPQLFGYYSINWVVSPTAVAALCLPVM